ncbi:MAG TPA: hypothetical protein VEY95_13445 [Azospirillaceae bacterium]|nr:hypothetical protein [Azospirillaceae bacterium]
MEVWTNYLDTIERQVHLDGFMTRVMRENLDRLRRATDDDLGERIEALVARYHKPYARGHLRHRG